MDSTPLPRYTILRRYRQRFFYSERSDGTPEQVYRPDFPVLHPLALLYQEFLGIPCKDIFTTQEYIDMAEEDMKGIEEMETKEWERGTTTEQLENEYLEATPVFHNTGMM